MVRGFDSDATGTYRIEIDESDPEPTPAPQTTAAPAPTAVPTAAPASTAAPAPKSESAPTATPTPQPTPAPQSTLAPARAVDDHADYITGATSISVGEARGGEIENSDDVDFFVFRTQKDHRYTIRIRHGTNPDTYLVLYDAEGRNLTEDFDSGGDGEPWLEWAAPSSGVYYVAVRGFNSDATGTYRIEFYESALWRYETGDEVWSSPEVSGGVVYVGSNDNRVYALDASTGDLIWSFETGDYVFSSPAVSGGVVYVGSNDNRVYALDASTGDLIWSYETGDVVFSSPEVSGGVVYVGSEDNRVYALDASTGELIWSYETGD